MTETEITYWAEKEYWSEEQLLDIKRSFLPLDAKADLSSAIGAGASGLFPEFHLLLTVSATLITSGFLTAVGEDLWKVIKKGIKQILKSKPIKMPEDLPKEYQRNDFELIWWVRAKDTSFIVHLKEDSEEQLESALNQLPKVVDEAILDKIEFSRVAWNGKTWDMY